MSDIRTKTRANGYKTKSPLENDTPQNSSTGVPAMEPDGIIESNWTEVVDQFYQMNLREPLLRGI
jgi:translation initiation factor 4A